MALVVFSQFAHIRCWVPVSSAVLLTQKHHKSYISRRLQNFTR